MAKKICMCGLLVSLLSLSCSPKQVLTKEVFQDCMKDRNNVETISNVDGTIVKVGDTYIITSLDGSMRYSPCNLTDQSKQEGLLVKFSVITKEIKSNERWVGTPCYLINFETINK
jgi:hypothetical protein